uniref:Thaumatin-like protein n=1 Tax=Bursaphelenchus xylophilus TaxID=6326 RepID=A0A0K0M9E0_BURXY|nr:thaumatin-like protein [Bursaphelenchus xylophilus]WGJ61538.1 TLP [Bursaphelenchus xylophilus]
MKTLILAAFAIAAVVADTYGGYTSFVLKNQCNHVISVYRTGNNRPETDQCILPTGIGCAIAFKNHTRFEFRANKEGRALSKFTINYNDDFVDTYEIDVSNGYDTPVSIQPADGKSKNLTCTSATCADAGQSQSIKHGGKFYVIYCP